MSRSCIRQLDLRLSLPEALQSKSSQIADELKQGFITRVVETIEQRLHASFGADAIIEIPVLTVKLEGDEKRFYDLDYAVQTGEDIAYELLMQWQGKPRAERLQPVHDDGVRFYECDAHKQAQQLQLLAESCQRYSNAWDYSELQQQWDVVCSEEKTILKQVLNYTDEMSCLKLVVENISLDGLQRASHVLPVSHWPSSIQTLVNERLSKASAETNSANQSTDESQTKSTAAPGQHSTKSIYPDQEMTPGQKMSENTSRDTFTPQPSDAPPGNNVYPLKTNQQSSETEGKSQRVSSKTNLLLDSHSKNRSIDDPLINNPLIKDTASTNDLDTSLDVANITPNELSGFAYYKTAYGGLFYVLNLILRIELPEILWCAAIDEKSFLFDLLSAMTGEGGKQDPALHIISGIHFDKNNYKASKIPTWAWEEVVRKVYKNSCDKLDKNAQLKFYVHYSDAGIETIINTEKIETKDSWISLVDICHRLLSTAFLCTLSPDDPDDTFLNYIKTQGVIKESDDEVSVELPMESINIEVRRAALDANPGYLAWQQRRLILNFIE